MSKVLASLHIGIGSDVSQTAKTCDQQPCDVSNDAEGNQKEAVCADGSAGGGVNSALAGKR
jgi:hypothetical protein